MPTLVLMYGKQAPRLNATTSAANIPLIIKWGITSSFVTGNSSSYDNGITYSGNTMTWYNAYSALAQWNESEITYHYVAIG